MKFITIKLNGWEINDSFSREILEFKKGEGIAVMKFYGLLLPFLTENLQNTHSFKIATVPRSKPNTAKEGFHELYKLFKNRSVFETKFLILAIVMF